MTTAAYFYFIIILIATAFAYLASHIGFVQERFMCGGTNKDQLNSICVLMSFITLFCLVAFSVSGTDYSRYITWFENAASYSLSEIFQREWAYLLFNRFVHYFTDDFHVYVIVYSAVVLLLIYSTLVKYSDKINFTWAIFIYSTQFFLPMCSAKRSTMAAAIVFFSMRYLLDKKYLRYFIAILIASGVHTSAIFWTAFLITYVVVKENLYKRHKILLVLGFVAIGALLIITRNYWINLDISERYESYEVAFSGIGLGLILKFFILFFICIRWGLQNEDGESWDGWRVGIISSGVSLVFAVSGYINQVFTRMNIYSIYAFAFFIPFVINYWQKLSYDEESYLTENHMIEINITKIILIAYMIFLYIDYATGTMITSGLGTYENIWGWSI